MDRINRVKAAWTDMSTGRDHNRDGSLELGSRRLIFHYRKGFSTWTLRIDPKKITGRVSTKQPLIFGRAVIRFTTRGHRIELRVPQGDVDRVRSALAGHDIDEEES